MLKKVNVMIEEWNYLIILDACRYDYFSQFYGDYLQGKLEEAYSPASCTLEWCSKSFQNFYDDVVYVSANPFINSKFETVRKFKFDARSHFFRIIDVWDNAWDEELGTVHPQKINETVQALIIKYPDKRFIIHYAQPHAPYLKVPNTGSSLDTSETRIKFLRILGRQAKRMGLFGGNPSWKIRELLNLPPETHMDAVRRMVGDEGLRQAYVENLRLVLRHVADLVEILSGIIVVTADHGELLGEGDCYSHPPDSTNPALRKIPWLTIKKNAQVRDGKEIIRNLSEGFERKENTKDTPILREEEKIRNRQKSLGDL